MGVILWLVGLLILLYLLFRSPSRERFMATSMIDEAGLDTPATTDMLIYPPQGQHLPPPLHPPTKLEGV